MTTSKQPKGSGIPEGHRTLAPYLIVRRVERAMDLYALAFGARELFHMTGPGDRISHAELAIGDSVLMLADENPEQGTRSPEAYGGTPASVFMYLNDVDAVFAKAESAGATIELPPTDMFWGDRYGKLRDPFGHEWGIATHVEDVTPEESQRRLAAMRG